VTKGNPAASAACPICKKPSAPRPANKNAPFCSARCKAVDLGQWLDEKYAVPAADQSAPNPNDEES